MQQPMTETYVRKAKYKFAKENIGCIFGGDFTCRSMVIKQIFKRNWWRYCKKL